MSFVSRCGYLGLDRGVSTAFFKEYRNSFQHLYFDGSLQPLFITWCYNHDIKHLRNHDGDAEDKFNFTYESRGTLKAFTLFITVKTIVKLNAEHSDKFEIKI